MRNRMIAVVLVTTLMLTGIRFASTGAGERAADKSVDARIAAFRAERVETLQAVVEALEAMYRAGRTDMARLMSARDKLVKVQIEQATTHTEKLALLKQHRDLASYAENFAETRFKDGRGTQVDCLQAKALRLKREIAVLRETDG